MALIPYPDLGKISPEAQEMLEKVADAKGINGLREIAEPLGLKGRSIPDLIKQILAAPNRITH